MRFALCSFGHVVDVAKQIVFSHMEYYDYDIRSMNDRAKRYSIKHYTCYS